MKNILKFISIFFIGLLFTNCQQSTDTDFSNDTESGWIEYISAETEIILDETLGETLDIPVRIEVPVSPNNLAINYDLISISGQDPNTIFSNNGTLQVPAGIYGTANVENPNIEFNLSRVADITSKMVFDVVLISTNNSNITVGIEGTEKITTHRVTICPISISSTYSGDAYSDDLGLAASTFPGYTTEFVPVPGESNMWTLESTWGPDFVSLLTGGAVPPGSFPYPSTVTLEDDGSVTVSGTEFYTSGGSGTYDICADTFTLSLTQGLFTGTFTVDVILVGNGD